jgi:hypothetical protein
VVFLATPEAADITGQIFVVFGGSIYAMSSYHPVGQLTREAEWTPQQLIEAKGELFKGVSSGVPPFSFL